MTSLLNEPRGDGFLSPSLSDQVAEVRRNFEKHFGVGPTWVVAAPGRVNLIGEHTDYNAGFVFPLAIERYVVIAAARGQTGAGGDKVRAHSALLDKSAEFSLSELEPARKDWTSYIRGVRLSKQLPANR
jgi:galactokinase